MLAARLLKLIPALLGAVWLVGCSSTDITDLQAYVAEVKTRKGGRVDPLPKIENYETFAYIGGDRRSPFKPSADAGARNEPVAAASGGFQPDFNRRRELTEEFPLDGLVMVGTIELGGVTYGLVQTNDGTVYRVREGNYVGQNHGKISSVREGRIDVQEIVPDGLGGWRQREANLSMKE